MDIQIQHLLKLNLSAFLTLFLFQMYSNTTLVKVKYVWLLLKMAQI